MKNIDNNIVAEITNSFDNELKKLLLNEIKGFKAKKHAVAVKAKTLLPATLAAA